MSLGVLTPQSRHRRLCLLKIHTGFEPPDNVQPDVIAAVENSGPVRSGGRRKLSLHHHRDQGAREEVGGEHIEQYVPKHREKLTADAALISDTEMFAPGLPTITTGLRAFGEVA